MISHTAGRVTPRRVPVAGFVTGNHQNVLAPGELLRSIFLPAHALRKTYAFRRFTLTHLGRSEALLIGTRCPEHGKFLLTITAATLRPVQLRFDKLPGTGEPTGGGTRRLTPPVRRSPGSAGVASRSCRCRRSSSPVRAAGSGSTA